MITKDIQELVRRACAECGITPTSDMRTHAEHVARVAIRMDRERCGTLTWEGRSSRALSGDLYTVESLSGNVWVTYFNGTAFPGWTSTLEDARAVAEDHYQSHVPETTTSHKFKVGDWVHKPKGSWWEGRVVGTYHTEQTPVGYCVQMNGYENGPVQIYPEAALVATPPEERPPVKWEPLP